MPIFGFGTMVFYKYLAAFFVFLMLVCVLELVRSGRLVKRLRPAGGVVYEDLLDHHQWVADWNLIISFTTVCLIEFLVHVSPAHQVNQWLRWPNILSGIAYALLLLLIRFKFNGEKYPRWHYKLGYAGKAMFVIALVTGAPMLYMLRLQ